MTPIQEIEYLKAFVEELARDTTRSYKERKKLAAMHNARIEFLSWAAVSMEWEENQLDELSANAGDPNA